MHKYGKNPSNIFFSWTKQIQSGPVKPGIKHLSLKAFEIYSNHGPRSSLIYYKKVKFTSIMIYMGK